MYKIVTCFQVWIVVLCHYEMKFTIQVFSSTFKFGQATICSNITKITWKIEQCTSGCKWYVTYHSLLVFHSNHLYIFWVLFSHIHSWPIGTRLMPTQDLWHIWIFKYMLCYWNGIIHVWNYNMNIMIHWNK
jgi:hypothetical protein